MTEQTLTTAGATASAPGCGFTGCSNPGEVQWRRRLTPDELDALIHQDPPVAGPVPTAETTTRAVYACGQHAIGMDLAGHVHAATCTAPEAKQLPGCGCTPEPVPVGNGPTVQPTVTLSTGWVVPAPS